MENCADALLRESRSIDIIVGLPHLNKGPLIERARTLQAPVLISANGLSRWSTRCGGREWTGWSTGQLANARGLHSLALDSAGFSAMVSYGGFPWTICDYIGLAASYPFRWWASLDYCVEHEIARDREEVLDRISRTIGANIECRLRGDDAGIAPTFMPVIQGRLPTDYERCTEALALTIDRATQIGVGSMCRRPIHGAEGLMAVVDHLDRSLPAGKRIHLFGVKGDALPYLLPYAHRVASIDSQAYGVSARVAACRSRRSKTDVFVADHMTCWLERQRARLLQAAKFAPIGAPSVQPAPPLDHWEAAVSKARGEIRSLIEAGDIDHDEVTALWVEQWAADIS